MAKKAIYTKVGNTYYKVNQDTNNPTEIVRMPRTHSQMNTDPAGRLVNTDIWINTIDGCNGYSNKELYDEMINSFKTNKVESISTIENHFIMYCDYSVYNENGKEINHNAVTYQLDPRDAVYNYGVNKESELVYKQVKLFDASIALNVKNEYPMGIMRNMAQPSYTLHINDISIYQDLVYTETDIHRSTDLNSAPISSVLNNMEKVYSTYENGMVISAVEVPFIPKKIMLNMHITLDDVIVVYDEQNIIDIVKENIGDDNISLDKIFILNGGSAHSNR